jgi:alkylation response protein AidB-like acyl-CoA dehydrogenase
MDFALNDEQRMIDDALARFVQQHYDFPARQRLLRTEAGYSRAHWQLFAEMGLLALPLDEEYGGVNADFSYTALLMESIGKGLVAEPYLAGVVLGGGVLRRAANTPQHAAMLRQLAAGEVLLAFAHDEPDAVTPAAPATRSRRHGDGYVLNGVKQLVLHGAAADHFIVSASDADSGELQLFLADAGQGGVALHRYRTVDGLPVCDMHLHELALDAGRLLAQGETAATILAEVLTDALAALCCEASGCAQALLDATLDYVRQRQQFGRAIGSFQVIQHRMADCYVEVEQIKSMALLASRSVAAGAPQRHRSVAAAKAYIGEAAVRVGHTAIQLHGAMGMTEELAVGAYHKRLLVIQALFGDAGAQVERYIALEQGSAS